ncbi:hypothetical protein HanXRQr2_Chr02g0077121 [Helianthus annuus]|uniref:Uncharacterized protein n=1 Tax=Helianthus annuus TaxID=4232 RepID=A0A251VHW6_HELAN|nr:hypothetical protein HanXRQr2_Chr02g0077121 [Helianthus annuus]KAJ0952656.1 hypothetical protein HanPSC8_Chr02g0074861 [Helianthus annuus]
MQSVCFIKLGFLSKKKQPTPVHHVADGDHDLECKSGWIAASAPSSRRAPECIFFLKKDTDLCLALAAPERLARF